ncbi:hypothetical protein [Herbiconiux daphne]|uniref:Uncharacterized protein n=1 Tax=Herbiconiux daphne TaxID=2970914 RepID=A0ABT2H6C2_9MICO|nr:hypothetical protein [Herbiconiux daphne]MCS5735467.1 hypothetical protein [Herbiconiux daphne]
MRGGSPEAVARAGLGAAARPDAGPGGRPPPTSDGAPRGGRVVLTPAPTGGRRTNRPE